MADACARGQLVIGNTATRKDAKRFNWVLYVRGATQHVKSVTIRLHPTFKNPVRKVVEPPFEFASSGWGVFDVDVTIAWKVGGGFETSWPLQFGSPDSHRSVDIPEDIVTANQGAAALSAEGASADAASSSDDGDHDEVEVAGPEAVDEAPEPPPLMRDTSTGTPNGDPLREAVTKRLRDNRFLHPSDPLFKFGRGYEGPLIEPRVTWKSNKPPREDHSAPKWLTASEFEDEPAVMQAKVAQLAQLIRLSRKTVAYTGAGISAAVIGQAALSGQNTVGWKADTRSAPPTFTHHSLGFLGREGLLHGWVQQNHDGLPQRAGFPQERINEIHGSWFDPSNPVVKYSGTLHNRSYPWMRDDAETADLVLVLGTSLGGLNADQVAIKTAQRSLLEAGPPEGVLAPGAWIRARPPGTSATYKGLVTEVQEETIRARFVDMGSNSDSESEESDNELGEDVTVPKARVKEVLRNASGGLGTVCLNLQQTPHDGKMTLRLFGKSDDLLRMLLLELGFAPRVAKSPAWPRNHRALVPYDADGRRSPPDTRRMMWLDLRDGQEVRITPGHNIQGAKQPGYMHIGAKKPITIKGVTRQPAEGIGTVQQYSKTSTSFILNIDGAQMRLGIWWLESALRGAVAVLPVVNRRPQFES